MSDHSVDRIIGDINGLNQEAEQFIHEIDHMIIKEEKLYKIHDEDIHYDGLDTDLKRTIREQSGTGVERFQPII